MNNKQKQIFLKLIFWMIGFIMGMVSALSYVLITE